MCYFFVYAGASECDIYIYVVFISIWKCAANMCCLYLSVLLISRCAIYVCVSVLECGMGWLR